MQGQKDKRQDNIDRPNGTLLSNLAAGLKTNDYPHPNGQVNRKTKQNRRGN